MGVYVARRLLLAAVAVVGLTVITFVISHAAPADPIVANLGQQASQRPEIVAAFRAKWGLDRPLHQQYLTFLRGVGTGDFGISIGLPLGVLSALYRDGPIDHLARLVSLVGVSIPIFWLATVSLVIFYATLGLAPGPGRLGPQIAAPPGVTGFYVLDSLLAGDGRAFMSALTHLVLPALVLSSSVMGLVTRVTRSSMLEVLSQDFMRTARAKGLAESTVVVRHALRNALIPTVTILGLAFGGLLSGAVMTETIFAWPGLGRYAFEAAVSNDFPSIMGVTFVIALMYVLANLAVDLLYGVLDPQIHYA